MRQLINITIIGILLCADIAGQDTGYGPAYQTMLSANPALSGAEGDGTLRLSYLNFFPGNGYNLHSFYFAYDTYIPAAHGGGGVWLSNDIQGDIFSDLKGGLSYSYFLRAGEELYISAGLSAGVFHRSFNFGSAVLPDMIDPFGGVILPPGETLQNRSRTVFDLSAGFLLIYQNFSGGIAVNHLSKPDISSENDQLERKMVFHGTYSFVLSPGNDLSVTPGFYGEIQGSRYAAGLGSSLGSERLSVSTILMANSNKNVNLQSGLAVGAGRIDFFYNYRLNLLRGNNLLPVSLQHQTGLAFSLNRVDKRNLLKTISLPKM